MSPLSTRRMLSGILATAMLLAACSSSSSNGLRNVALEGKTQCLSDTDTKISADGIVTMVFCEGASSYKIIDTAINAAEFDPLGLLPETLEAQLVDKAKLLTVDDTKTGRFDATKYGEIVHVYAFDASNKLIGQDVVTSKIPTCATGGACLVGETGPLGGIVIHGYDTAQTWGQYIEMAKPYWAGDYYYHSTKSPDPFYYFGCIGTGISTSEDIGTAVTNTDAFISKCNEPDTAPVKVRTINKDWSIPSYGDLRTIDAISAELRTKLNLTAYFFYNTSSSTDDGSKKTIATGFGKDNSRQISVERGYSYSLPVRPVHYFSATNAVATVTVVGILDAPVPTTTTTTTTEVPATSTTVTPDSTKPDKLYSSRVGDQFVLSWTDTEVGAKHEVSYVLENDLAVVGWTGECTDLSCSISAGVFVKDKAYTFTVKRKGAIEVLSSPLTVIPNPSTAVTSTPQATKGTISETTDPETSVGSTSTSTSTSVSDTSTSVPGTSTTSAATVVATTTATTPDNNLPKSDIGSSAMPNTPKLSELDTMAECANEPKLTVDAGESTSDGTVKFTITHSCFGFSDLAQVWVDLIIANDGVSTTTFSNYLSNESSDEERANFGVITREIKLPAGKYTATATLNYKIRLSSKLMISPSAPLSSNSESFDIAQGKNNRVACNAKSIAVEGENVIWKCDDSVVAVKLILDELYTDNVIKGKDNVFKISDFPAGYNFISVYSEDEFGNQASALTLFACFRECDSLPKGFAVPHSVTESGIIVGPFAAPCSPLKLQQSAIVYLKESSKNIYEFNGKFENISAPQNLDAQKLDMKNSDAAMVMVGALCVKATGASLNIEWSFISKEEVATWAGEKPSTNTVVSVPVVAADEKPAAVIRTQEVNFKSPSAAAPLAILGDVESILFDVKTQDAIVSSVQKPVDYVTVRIDKGKPILLGKGFAAKLDVPADAKEIEFTAVTTDGESIVLTKPIERAQSAEVVLAQANESGSSSNSMLYIIIAIAVLIAALVVVQARRKKATA